MARLLDHKLATAYSVREEVLVGKLPLRVDILLIRRETGELLEASRRDLTVLVVQQIERFRSMGKEFATIGRNPPNAFSSYGEQEPNLG